MNSNALLATGNYIKHHTSYARGYHTVKGETIEKYKGRFGRGYKVHTNAPNTTSYHFVTYIIER